MTHVESLDLSGKAIFSVMDGGLLICLERGLTLDAIRAMADRGP